MRLAEGGRGQAEVDLLELLLGTRHDLGGGAGRPPVLARSSRSQLAEVAMDELGGGLVVEMAGGRDEDVLRPVDLAEERGQLLPLELRNAALGAEDGTAERMVGPEGLGQELHDE